MTGWHVTAERRHVVVPRGGGLAPVAVQCVISRQPSLGEGWRWWVHETDDSGAKDDSGAAPTAAGGEDSKGRAVSLRRATVKEGGGG